MNSGTGAAAGRASVADAWFSPGKFALVLLVLISAAFPDVLSGSRSFFFRDFGFFGYPLAHYHRESFWRGEVPLWNPLSNCGLPFLAQWNTMVLYPGSLLYVLLPLPWSLNLFCLAHLFIAGMSMYFLALDWTRNRLAAALAGLGFAFNGLTLNCLMWPNNIAALSLMPMVTLLVGRACVKGGWAMAGSVALGATQMLSGAPEIIVFTWVLSVIAALLEFPRSPPERIRFVLRLSLIVILVTVLSAAQLLPFFDLLAHSQRDANFAKADWPMPGSGWANFLVPLFRTYRNPVGVHFQLGQNWTSSYYVGIAGLALALLAAWRIRNARVWFLAGAGGISLILALGDGGVVYPALVKLVPHIGFMRYPIKFIVPVVFCLTLLAAYGASDLLARCENGVVGIGYRLTAIWLVLLLLIGGILWFGFHWPQPGENWPGTFRNGVTRACLLTLAMLALWTMPRIRRVGTGLLVRVGFLALVGVDLLTHVPRQNPTISPAALEPGLAPLRELNPRPSPGQSRAMLSAEADRRLRYEFSSVAQNNYIVKRVALFANANLLEGLPKVNGFYSLYLKETDDLLSLVYGQTNRFTSQLADALGVSQITSPGELFEWQSRTSFLPFAALGADPRFCDPADALDLITSDEFDPHQSVLLPLDARPHLAGIRGSGPRPVVSTYSSHEILAKVETREAALLVFSQSHYHPWRAYLNGKQQPIWRANHAFQALAVPAGTNVIRLVYRDRAFVCGLLVSALGLSGCQLWRFTGRKRGSAPEI